MSTFRQSLTAVGRPFWLLWAGGSISMIGTQLVQFALNVWVYQKTNSVLSFSGVILAGSLPVIITTPFAGAIIDRFNRLHIMVSADLLVALAMLVLLVFVWIDTLEVYHLYIFSAYFAFCGTFQRPAHQASVADMVQEKYLTKANGAMGVSTTLLGIVTPTLAGVLLMTIGLKGLVLIDLFTFVIGTLLAWRAFSLLQQKREPLGASKVVSVVLESFSIFLSSLSIFKENHNLFALFIYTLIQSAMVVVAIVLVTPLVLSIHSSASLGLILSCAAGGALLGSLLLVALDSPPNRMRVVFIGDTILAFCIVLAGFVTSVIAFCILEFLASFAGSIVAGCAYSLWMAHVAEERRGSIMAILNAGVLLSGTLMVVFGGIIIEFVFQPALATDGILASSLGVVLGSGEGRGTALMFVLSGLISLMVIGVGFSQKSLRELH